MKKCLWDTIIIIELWFLQFSTNKQANKQSLVIHRFILHAALLGHDKLAHAVGQRFLFPLKRINRGVDRDGSRLLAYRLSTTDLREWKPPLDLSASVILLEPRSEAVANVTMNTSEKNVSRKTTQASKFSTYASRLL